MFFEDTLNGNARVDAHQLFNGFSGGHGALLRLVFRRRDISILRSRHLANHVETRPTAVLGALSRRHTWHRRHPRFASVSGPSTHSHLSSSDNLLLWFYLLGFLQGLGGQICPGFWAKNVRCSVTEMSGFRFHQFGPRASSASQSERKCSQLGE